ncbi:MAG TPA: hypothetical protein DDY98_01130, partial [Ruminococcaceae bacterium]|nr:hypothetical protein [Oscillospiraceae bacterium]
MNSIHVNFSDSRAQFEVNQGEHNINTLVFAVPADFIGADYVNAEFKKSDGTTDVVEQLTPSGGTVSVPLTQNLVDTRGTLSVQLVAYAVNGTEIEQIAKSPIVIGVVRVSLNALHDKTAPGFLERLVAFVDDCTAKLAELLAAKHSHSNKLTLDSVDSQTLSDLSANTSARHTHGNKATILDKLTTNAGAVIGVGSDSRTVLSFDGSALRFVGEGGVVRNVETVTVGGQTFLRLWFDYGANVEFEIGAGNSYNRPAFIDIPVSTATASTVTVGTESVTGTE